MSIDIENIDDLQIKVVKDEIIEEIISHLSPNSQAKIQVTYNKSSEGDYHFTAICKGFVILTPSSRNIIFTEVENNRTLTIKGIYVC